MRTAWLLVLGLGLACDSAPDAARPGSTPEAKATVERKAEPEAQAAAPERPSLAPPPPGAVIIDGVYVQTCEQAEACPALRQRAGDAHCRGLTLGGLAWRLPTIEQLEAWKASAGLRGFDVFHWSGSPWDEDPQQWWIYDPGSGSKTTARPDRKPFTIRCVAGPG